MTSNSQINLAERANNQQKIQASYSHVEQNANFLPLSWNSRVKLLRSWADMDGLYRCNLPLKTSSENRQKHSKHITGKVLQTLFGFLGIFHGKPPIIFDRIALVTCGVNWSAQTRESVFCVLKRSSFYFLSHS